MSLVQVDRTADKIWLVKDSQNAPILKQSISQPKIELEVTAKGGAMIGSECAFAQDVEANIFVDACLRIAYLSELCAYMS